MDETWKDPVSGKQTGEGSKVVSGDVKLLKKIEDLRRRMGEREEQNGVLIGEKTELEDKLLQECERADKMEREKDDVERARQDLLSRLETMKQEWLAEALEDKQFVRNHNVE